jgi:hypothetical protein
MRRLIALLVIALVGAGAYGLFAGSSAVGVNGTNVSNSTFLSELSAISSSQNLQCYLQVIDNVGFSKGAGGSSLANSATAAWANTRVEGIAIDQYATKYLDYRATPSVLAEAKSSLEGEMTAAASSASKKCPGTSAAALASMPTEMLNATVQDQAASTYLVSKLNTTIPITLSSIKTYYASHVSQYDTLCVSVAVVSPAQLGAFTSAQKSGASVAELARKFSVDTSAPNGGAYGCYPPGDSSFASVRSAVGTTAIGHFASTPQMISYNNGEYYLFVAPTSRTTTPFASAASAVLSDIQSINSSSANTVKQNILYTAAVSIDPAFGSWGLNSSGPDVFATSTPSSTDVSAASVLATPSSSTYK